MRQHLPVMIIILFLFFICFGSLTAQDSISAVLDYYPLDNGNYWEYVDWADESPFPSPPGKYFSVQVKRDSLLMGKNYKILEYRNLPDNGKTWFTYERVDSSTGNVYRYDFTLAPSAAEFLLDSLCTDSGDVSRASRVRGWEMSECTEHEHTYCLWIEEEDSILNIKTPVKYFYDCCFIPCGEYRLAKGLGYLGYEECEFSCGGIILLYARIRGVEYGEKVNAMNSPDNHILSRFNLLQNYPNPFNSISIIKFEIPVTSYIELSLFDLAGKKIRTIYQGMNRPGTHQAKINCSELSSGIYIYALRGKNVLLSRKCVLIK